MATPYADNASKNTLQENGQVRTPPPSTPGAQESGNDDTEVDNPMRGEAGVS